MREVGLFEAKNTLSALVDCAMRGEEVVITRHGKAVARLIKEPQEPAGRDKARRAAASLAELSRGLTLNGLSIRELVDEGRP